MRPLLNNALTSNKKAGINIEVTVEDPRSDHVETTIDAPLSDGFYFISSPALQREDLVLGRGIREDMSLGPKPIKTVSCGDADQILVIQTSLVLFLTASAKMLCSGRWSGWTEIATFWGLQIH